MIALSGGNINAALFAVTLQIIKRKGLIYLQMISITKDEKDAIIKKFPKAHIVRTMASKSKRHHYYCTEEKPVIRHLTQIRSCTASSNASKEDGSYTDRTNTR